MGCWVVRVLVLLGVYTPLSARRQPPGPTIASASAPSRVFPRIFLPSVTGILLFEDRSGAIFISLPSRTTDVDVASQAQSELYSEQVTSRCVIVVRWTARKAPRNQKAQVEWMFLRRRYSIRFGISLLISSVVNDASIVGVENHGKDSSGSGASKK